MFQMPMSSDMMTRMLGFFSAAAAVEAEIVTAHTRATVANRANHPFLSRFPFDPIFLSFPSRVRRMGIVKIGVHHPLFRLSAGFNHLRTMSLYLGEGIKEKPVTGKNETIVIPLSWGMSGAWER